MKRMRSPIAWENVIKQKKQRPKCTANETNIKLIAKSLSIRQRSLEKKGTRKKNVTHNTQIDENYYKNLGR